MSTGDGRDDGGPSKTAEGDVGAAVPTPAPVVRSAGVRERADTPTPEEAAMVGAKTAVATKSQQMNATDPPADPGSTDEREKFVGKILTGRYEITRQIGAGGMGAVYEATHRLIGKRVAVKVLLDKYAEKDLVIARLEQEARLASSIGHPNIIDITDFGETDEGRRFVVMEYLDGESLGQRLADGGPMPMKRIAHICIQIASALGAAHKKGIVHRDVKPENIFMITRGDDKDFCKVVDFGISKAMRQPDGDTTESPRLTQTGMILGTPLYMSPEQARGDEDLDERIDIYALGVILYELSTGEVPFRGNNYLNIISQVLSSEPTPPRELRPDLAISEELEAVTLKALAKDRELRYQSTDELVNDLSALAGGGEVGAISGSFWAMRKRATRRSPLRIVGWVAAVAVVIAAMAFTITTMMGGGENKAAVPPATDAGPARVAVTPDATPDPDKVVDIKLTSRPGGATVWADGGQRLICESTPCVWSAVKKDRVVELIFELDGYDDADIKLNPLTANSKQVVRLVKTKKGRKKKSLKRNKTTPGGGNAKPGGGGVDLAGGELGGNPIKKKKQQQDK